MNQYPTYLREFLLRLKVRQTDAPRRSPRTGNIVLVERWEPNKGFHVSECRVTMVGAKHFDAEEVAVHFPNHDGTVRTVAGDSRLLTCRVSHFETSLEERFRFMTDLIMTLLKHFPHTEWN